jgi:outer membrane protein TolC
MTRRIPALAALLLGASCTVGPDFRRPVAPPDRGYSSSEQADRTAAADGKAQRFVEGLPVAADWWRLFHSVALDATVDRAMTASPGLEQARATLRQNQDLLRAGYGVFFPQVNEVDPEIRTRN